MNKSQQRQFEQTIEKLKSHIFEMEDIIKELMPIKGNSINDCQRTYLMLRIKDLKFAINGIDIEDFTPNSYSGDFKLSYS